jgi:Fuc2NAc and GlcNAc transferase
MSTGWVALAVAVFAWTWYLTGRVRRYALDRMILDVPTDRSSHDRPVPRGAGLALATALLSGVVVAGLAGWVPASLAMALAGGGSAVAAVGWVDDRRGLSPRLRATVQFLAAVWALMWIGGMPAVHLGTVSFRLEWVGWIVGILGIMWGTNLYNFMDGIDGLAGGEAVTVGLSAALLLAQVGHADLAGISTLTSAAGLGFLLWNWPPAKIFLGDVGSGLLGFVFATLAIASENAGALPLAAWLVLVGTFFVDATVTVARRIARGERWFEAHRSHAYQRAVQSGLSHGTVTGVLLSLNVLLAAIVWWGIRQPRHQAALLLLGFGLLLGVYLLIERRRPMDRWP